MVTSDVRGAGTDAAVSLELCGPAGSPAGPWVLDRQGAFGRGQVSCSGLWAEDGRAFSVMPEWCACELVGANASWHHSVALVPH